MARDLPPHLDPLALLFQDILPVVPIAGGQEAYAGQSTSMSVAGNMREENMGSTSTLARAVEHSPSFQEPYTSTSSHSPRPVRPTQPSQARLHPQISHAPHVPDAARALPPSAPHTSADDPHPDADDSNDDSGAETERAMSKMGMRDILDDLNSRFLLNLPVQEMDLIRLYWQTEQA